MLASLVIVLSFISIIPIPQRFIPAWNTHTLRYFCPMLAVSGVIFASLWLIIWAGLLRLATLSPELRGFFMAFITLVLTGGLHLDGLMDTCDAIFSRQDTDTRLKILSDTHAGSFAVIGCVVVMLAKTLLFSEMLQTHAYSLVIIPAYSRLGMAMLMNNLPFAKPDGLAVMLGSSRARRDNVFLGIIAAGLGVCSWGMFMVWAVSLLIWRKVCLRVFGGITGDLLGAFVEISEAVMLAGEVMRVCLVA